MSDRDKLILNKLKREERILNMKSSKIENQLLESEDNSKVYQKFIS